MKYLVIYNSSRTVNVSAGGGGQDYSPSYNETVFKPFDDLTEAFNLASEKKGYVVKLVQVEITEVIKN